MGSFVGAHHNIVCASLACVEFTRHSASAPNSGLLGLTLSSLASKLQTMDSVRKHICLLCMHDFTRVTFGNSDDEADDVEDEDAF